MLNRRRYSLSLILLALSLLQFACMRRGVEDSEKELFLRAHELADYGYAFQDTARHESFNKTIYFDGSYDIEYIFETPEDEVNDPLYLSITVTVERNATDAGTSQKAEEIGLTLGSKLEGITIEEKKGFFQYGDTSTFYVLLKDGNPIGNYFSTREGRKVYTLTISGMYIDDAELWGEMIMPKLKRFSEYKSR